MKLMTILYIPMICLTSLFLSGCQSLDYSIGGQVIKHEVADISITMTSLSRDDLKVLYGSEENPFIDFPGRFPNKEFFVYETEITTESSTLKLSRTSMDMQLGSDTYKSSNNFRLIQAWTPYFKSDTHELHMKQLINKTLKPTDFTITPESPFRGLLVFLVPLVSSTEAIIHIPAETAEGDFGIIEIPFTLERFISGKRVNNTGIFSK